MSRLRRSAIKKPQYWYLSPCNNDSWLNAGCFAAPQASAMTAKILIGVRTGIAPIIGLHWAFVLAFVVLCVFFADCNRANASRAISDGACCGSGSTELTLISQST
jgi:hypothetical protein